MDDFDHGFTASMSLMDDFPIATACGWLCVPRRSPHVQHRALGIDRFYMLDVGGVSGAVIDCTHKGNEARFINHSCEPNCEVQMWNVGGLKRFGIFATAAACAGVELTFDYGFNQFEDAAESLPCYCGTRACNGYIGGGGRTHRNAAAAAASRKVPSPSHPHHAKRGAARRGDDIDLVNNNDDDDDDDANPGSSSSSSSASGSSPRFGDDVARPSASDHHGARLSLSVSRSLHRHGNHSQHGRPRQPARMRPRLGNSEGGATGDAAGAGGGGDPTDGGAVAGLFCSACGGIGTLMCCDGCPAAFHVACAEMTGEMPCVTTGVWFCPACRMF